MNWIPLAPVKSLTAGVNDDDADDYSGNSGSNIKELISGSE
jgi:hypothetical protein